MPRKMDEDVAEEADEVGLVSCTVAKASEIRADTKACLEAWISRRDFSPWRESHSRARSSPYTLEAAFFSKMDAAKHGRSACMV